MPHINRLKRVQNFVKNRTKDGSLILRTWAQNMQHLGLPPSKNAKLRGIVINEIKKGSSTKYLCGPYTLYLYYNNNIIF